MSGCPVAWRSKLQRDVALSSTEAEYLALSAAVKEAMWIKQLLTECGFKQGTPMTIFEDNQGCISISHLRRTDDRTKHIDVRFHHTRDQIERGTIRVIYCPTENMMADMLTKSICATKLRLSMKKIGMSDILTMRLREAVEPNSNHLARIEVNSAFGLSVTDFL